MAINLTNQLKSDVLLFLLPVWRVNRALMICDDDDDDYRISDSRLIWCRWLRFFASLLVLIHTDSSETFTRQKTHKWHVPRRKRTTAEQESTSWLNAKQHANSIWTMLLRNDFIKQQGANLIRRQSSIIALRELFRSKAHAKCFWLMESLWRWTLQHLILPDRSN